MEDLPLATDRIIALIKLTGNLLSLAHEHLWVVDEVPNDLQILVDKLQLLGKVLTGLQNHSSDSGLSSPVLQKLYTRNGPLFECAAELKRLQSKLHSGRSLGKDTKELSWLWDKKQILPHVLRIEKHRKVFTLALQLINDQSKLSEAMARYIPDGNDGENNIQTGSYAESRALRTVMRRKESFSWLYPGDFDSRYLELQEKRLKGTGEWLLQSPIFQKWMKGMPGFLLLWGHAMVGAGKTYISSKIIDHIQVGMQTWKYAVAYIFFDHEERDRQRPKHVLSCLITQLACQARSCPLNKLQLRLRDQQLEPTVAKLSRTLTETAKSFDRVFLVFDGLNECDQIEREDLLLLFHTLAKGNTSVFVTSQLQTDDIQRSLRMVAQIDLSARDEDIKIHIEKEIDDNPRVKRLLQQGKYRDQFVAELTACAGGIFLLANLWMKSLCQQPTVKLLFKEIERLRPLWKEEDRLLLAYTQLIDNVCRQSQACTTMALRVITWLVKAQRTLMVGELREAIAVEADRYELQERDLLDNETLLDICGGLVTIYRSSSTVRLIHHTTKGYILRSRKLRPDADHQVALACITYLSFNVFAEIADGSWVWGSAGSYFKFSNRLREHPFFGYATKYMSAHINACDLSLTTNAFLKFIKNHGQMASYIQAQLEEKRDEGEEEGPGDISPLRVSALAGHFLAVRHLIATEGYQLCRGKNGRTALREAAKGNHVDIVRLLLERRRAGNRGANPRAASDAWETTDTASLGDRDWGEGKPALHCAARRGYKDVVRLLLEGGVGVDSSGEGQQTALHEAVRGGHEEIVNLLLDKGASVWKREENGQTALHIAAEEGHERIVTRLLQYCDGVSTEAQEHGWESTLITEKGHKDLVKRRHVDLGIGVSAFDRLLRTPLYFAALGGHTRIAQLLIEKGADVSVRDTSGETILHQAARGGEKSIVQLLLQHGAEVSVKTHSDITVLGRAAVRDYADIFQILIDNGANTSARTIHDAVSLALAQGQGETVQLLLHHGAKILTPNEADNVLLEAAERGHCDVVKVLLNNGAKIPSKALYEAAAKGHGEMVELLLERGADISFRDGRRQSALHAAADLGDEDVVKILLGHGADVLAQDDGEQTPLHRAACAKRHPTDSSWSSEGYGNEEIVQLLLEFGADISAQDKLKQTALIIAAKRGRKEVVQVLIANGSDVLGHDVDGNTALHLAVGNGHTEVVKLLLDHGAHVPARNQKHQTALLTAAMTKYSKKEIVQLLLKGGADIWEKDEEGRTPFYIAAVNGHNEIVRLLIENGADISERDEKGQTAFIHAVKKGYHKIVEVILQKGGDISEKDKDGQTALFLAAQNGCHEVLELLIKKGVDISEKGKDGQSAFFVAAGRGHLEVVRLLLENGADVSEKNSDGQTALFLAAAGWHRDVFQLLINKGANEFERDRHGKTASLPSLESDDGYNDCNEDFEYNYMYWERGGYDAHGW